MGGKTVWRLPSGRNFLHSKGIPWSRFFVQFPFSFGSSQSIPIPKFPTSIRQEHRLSILALETSIFLTTCACAKPHTLIPVTNKKFPYHVFSEVPEGLLIMIRAGAESEKFQDSRIFFKHYSFWAWYLS